MKKPKKTVSTKSKIIICTVIACVLFLFALYLGMRLQVALTRFMFYSTFTIAKFLFWGVLIIAVILAAYVFYLVRKYKNKRDHHQ